MVTRIPARLLGEIEFGRPVQHVPVEVGVQGVIEAVLPAEQGDHRRHFDALLPAFMDQRCLEVDGKPLFAINRPLELPESRRVLDLWRELAVKAGLAGLFIVGEQ